MPSRHAIRDLVGRDFHAAGMNPLRVVNISDVPGSAGFLVLVVVLDVWSRRIASRAMATDLRPRLLANALDMAMITRKPPRLMQRSDEGSELGFRCEDARVRHPTGSVSDADDNAMAEAFFATLEHELLGRRSPRSQAGGRMAGFAFIDGFYNSTRRRSAWPDSRPPNTTPEPWPRTTDPSPPTHRGSRVTPSQS